MRNGISASLIAALLFLSAPVPAQQDQGVITGTISDATGAVVPGAQVTIREMNTGITVEKEANASGIYVSGPLNSLWQKSTEIPTNPDQTSIKS